MQSAAVGLERAYQDQNRTSVPTVAAAVPDVPLNLGQLSNNVDSLHCCISDLEQRLSCVMRPPSPKASNASPCAEVSQENVARRIADSSTLVRSAYERVVEILNRLEI